MTLAEFLLARIAEDEADAQAAMPGPWTLDGGTVMAGHPTNEVVDWAYDENGPHIARWDPARVLAECEAKREIVEQAGNVIEDEFVDAYHQVMSMLTRPYRDHPDYREEWR
jgi:hypothetical protein